MTLALRGVSKAYGTRSGPVSALASLDLEARSGELLVILGPSGSGKTTLLRCIAGLEALDEGAIWLADKNVTDLPPGERDVAMVFQDYALFPHLSARENITFGLKARKLAPDAIEQRLADAAEVLSIGDVLGRRPQELSGGERQRIALARAMVREPAVFLMDEPLSDLDAEMRADMRAEIRSLQRGLATTMLHVTHDQVEALSMGDRIAILDGGLLQQIGTPEDLYERPATTFVARFLGSPGMNIVPAGLIGAAGAAYAGVRPERLSLTATGAGRLGGRVVSVERIGHEVLVRVLTTSGETLVARAPAPVEVRAGDEVGFDLTDAHIARFGADGRAIG